MLLANPIIRPASNKASSIGRNQDRLGDAIIFSLSVSPHPPPIKITKNLHSIKQITLHRLPPPLLVTSLKPDKIPITLLLGIAQKLALPRPKLSLGRAVPEPVRARDEVLLIPSLFDLVAGGLVGRSDEGVISNVEPAVVVGGGGGAGGASCWGGEGSGACFEVASRGVGVKGAVDFLGRGGGDGFVDFGVGVGGVQGD